MREMQVRSKDFVTKPAESGGLVLEAWIEGFMMGALIVMVSITAANMRRAVLLHKLILIELLLSVWSGTAIFPHPPVYGWYLSTTGLCLYLSYSLHNVIAWIKNDPFLSRRASRFYIATVTLAQPFWVFHIYANFAYYNNINKLFLRTRPLEALFRDPWWLYTSANLFWNVKARYDFSFIAILYISPRFTVLLVAMALSVCFLILDVLSVTNVLRSILPTGINPFWKLSFTFKCLTDSVILDDFKTTLDNLRQVKLRQLSPNRTGTLPRQEMKASATHLEMSGGHLHEGM